MVAKLRASMLIVALVAGMGAGAANAATSHKKVVKKHALTQTQTKFYMNSNAATASCTEAPTLATKPDASGSEGCGTRGIPLEEAFYRAGSPTFVDFITTKHDGMPLLVDATRKITGQIGTRSWTGVDGGVGTVTVNIEVAATPAGGGEVVISDQQLNAALSPIGNPVTNLPWTASVPGSLAGKTLTSFRVSVEIHGTYVDQGAEHYQGDSYVIVPGFK